MLSDGISRRDYLTLVGAGATVAATASTLGCSQQQTKQAGKAEQAKPVPPRTMTAVSSGGTRPSSACSSTGVCTVVLGRHEWVMEQRGHPGCRNTSNWPRQFKPKPNAARAIGPSWPNRPA